MTRPVVLSLLLSGICLAGSAHAQHTTVIQAENVRYAYAQVLKVTPVFQTLTATRTEQRCEPDAAADPDSKLSRVVGAVKDALRRNPGEQEPQASQCRQVPVVQEFRRPIAYDVDYTYRGAKYRSRLPEDPGNRLRIRVSVVPVVGGSRTP